MPELNCPGPLTGGNGCSEAVCIHTSKVYDQCKSKECIRDLRVYLPTSDQALINNNSVTVRPRSAELLHVSIDVEKINFHRGFYSVDLRYYYKITAEVCTGAGRPTIIEGLSVFDKRCILFGSEGGARIFASKYVDDGGDIQLTPRSNLPRAVVEVVDPILLEAKVISPKCCPCLLSEVPPAICRCFQGEALDLCTNGNLLVVTLGQFSIIKMERDIQLLMPAFDVCMPEKDCSCSAGSAGEAEDPCDIFSTFAFPMEEFFPPQNDCHRGCGAPAPGTCIASVPAPSSSTQQPACGCNAQISPATDCRPQPRCRK